MAAVTLRAVDHNLPILFPPFHVAMPYRLFDVIQFHFIHSRQELFLLLLCTLEVNIGKSKAFRECPCADLGYAVGNHNIRQMMAVLKRGIIQQSNPIRNDHGCQAVTRAHCALTYADEPVRKGNGRHIGQTIESVRTNTGNAGLHNNRKNLLRIVKPRSPAPA